MAEASGTGTRIGLCRKCVKGPSLEDRTSPLIDNRRAVYQPETSVKHWRLVAVGGAVILVVALASIFGHSHNPTANEPSSTSAPAAAQSVVGRAQRVSYGDVINGRIEKPGTHDVYSFFANPGDVIHVSGDGCDLDNLVLDLVETNGRELAGPSCSPGSDAQLTDGGTYELVINAANGEAGSYHFVLQDASSLTK